MTQEAAAVEFDCLGKMASCINYYGIVATVAAVQQKILVLHDK